MKKEITLRARCEAPRAANCYRSQSKIAPQESPLGRGATVLCMGPRQGRGLAKRDGAQRGAGGDLAPDSM